MLPKEKIEAVEKQIEAERKVVNYDTKEYTIEIIVDKYSKDLDKNDNEFYVPEYQREFVWDENRQSKLIESIILGLPIPSIFLAQNKDGRCEIVDGSQRIRTFNAFLKNELKLVELEKLNECNGMKYNDFDITRKRKILNTTQRIIVLSEDATDDVKNDLFERINRGSDLLKEMEKRKGIYKGEFLDFIHVCAENKDFKKVTPICRWLVNRRERDELVLRFFAFADTYPKIGTGKNIAQFLDKYVVEQNTLCSENHDEFEQQLVRKKQIFNSMINFVQSHFKYGFAKDEKPQTSRVFFEAISVGTYLALEEKDLSACPNIDVQDWIKDSKFYSLISGKYVTHTQTKIKERIDFVKNKILQCGVSQ